MRWLLYPIVFIAFFFLALPQFVFANSIFFQVDNEMVRVGTPVEVGIFLDASEEIVNAIEGAIVLPKNLSITADMIKTGNSIVSLWVERPKSTDDNAITFSGIIPGGYNGSRGLLFSFIVVPQTTDTEIVTVQNLRVLKHDGQGTLISVNASPLRLTAQMPKTSDQQQLPIQDYEPPEIFVPIVTSNPSIANGKKVIIFLAQDKQSGVVGYEVREGDRQSVPAESPYVLQNQDIDDDIVVVARDAAGNTRSVVIFANDGPMVWLKKSIFKITFTLLVTGCCVYVLRRIIWRQR
ncbi:MAG: hypothetical protein KBD73_03570 [Candidatus Magasanikbacteria bacterium]|jgi:hypothetical protein|nr:hypothetical protein [Candidatus Magasanikbacteria bacterium]